MTAPAEPHVMKTYGRLPIALSHGRGCRVWDTDGREYLDALGGIAVNTLGHAHPRLVPALQEQVAKLIHTSNYYHVPLQEQLAARLTALSGLTNAFFCNSGLEANEAALKIARLSSPRASSAWATATAQPAMMCGSLVSCSSTAAPPG